MLLLLIFLFLSLNKISALFPRAVGGGCIEIKDELYYLGGFITLPNVEKARGLNKEIFKLDFKKGVTLYNNMASWERYNTTHTPESFMYPKLFYIEDFNKKNTMIGFFFGKLGSSVEVNYLDIDKDEWYDKHLIKEISYQPEIESFMDHYEEYSIVQSESNPKQFYISGFFHNFKLDEDINYQIKLFDIESKEIKTIYEPPRKMKVKLSFISNNKLYYFEVSIESIVPSVNYNMLYELDLSAFELVSHEIPFKSFGEIQIIKVRESIYFFGSDLLEDNSIEVFELKTQPFSFTKINRVVRISAWGCFANYKNYIINSFGNKFVQSSDRLGWVPESSDKTQILDTQTWQDIESLPSILEENNDTNSNKNDSADNNNLRAIVGGTIGGIVGLIIILLGIFLMFYRRKLKKEKPPSVIIDPIFIDPNIHLDSNNNNNTSAIFSHSHEIDDNNTGLTGNLYLNQIGNMNMINQENRSINETILGQSSESREDHTRIPSSI